MFSLHTTPEELEDATISGHFGFAFEKNSGKEITLLSKCLPSTIKRKAGKFKSLRDEARSVFENFQFRDKLLWTVSPTIEIKLRFQIPPMQCVRAFNADTNVYNDALPGQCRSPLQTKTEVLLQERLCL